MKQPAMKRYARLLTMFLTLIMITSSALAVDHTIRPLASDYLYFYSAYIADKGNGKLNIHFSVNCSGEMSEIGASSITLMWSSNGTDWYTAKTFKPRDHSQMLSQNKISYMSSVTYSGTKGKYYKALVTFYAKNSSGSDSISIWTSQIKAK